MKAIAKFLRGFWSTLESQHRPVVLGISALLFMEGCATDHTARVSVNTSRPATHLFLEPGGLGIRPEASAPTWSFDPPQGRVKSAGEGAAFAAGKVLGTPNLWHPQIEAGVGVLGFVAAPFAAGYGALSSKHERLPADKLAEATEDLASAMGRIARQECLGQSAFEQASEATRRPVILMNEKSATSLDPGAVGTVLHTEIQNLRLNRSETGGDNFYLSISARARLTRASDGAVLWDRPFQYQSREAMFIDWTLHDGLESVARTGYRELAGQMLRESLPDVATNPVLLGAGYRKGSTRQPTLTPPLLADRDSDAQPVLQRVAYQPAAALGVEIYSMESKGQFLIQRPLAKDEAVAEAQTETEWALDGLENHRNSVVQAAACLAAVPIGLWHQTVGLVRGGSMEAIEAGEKNLKLAAAKMRDRPMLAAEIVRFLPSQMQEPALLAGLDRSGETGNDHWIPAEVTPVSHQLQPRADDLFVEVRVTNAKLEGAHGVNPRLALCVDAEARVRRHGDGAEVQSFPVSYRSSSKRFKTWAAKDANLLREEWRQAYSEIGKTIADDLVKHGLVPPRSRSNPLIAKSHIDD